MLEETGLTVTSGRLACVDFLRPRARRPGGLRFLFDCGIGRPRTRGTGSSCRPRRSSDYRWADPDEAVRLLSGPVGRRVGQVLPRPAALVYLEEGRPVAGVTG